MENINETDSIKNICSFTDGENIFVPVSMVNISMVEFFVVSEKVTGEMEISYGTKKELCWVELGDWWIDLKLDLQLNAELDASKAFCDLGYGDFGDGFNAEQVSYFFVFGESFEDTGNVINFSSLSPWKNLYGSSRPSHPYGRFSSGNSQSDCNVQMLGLPPPLPFGLSNVSARNITASERINYAVAGRGGFDNGGSPKLGTQFGYCKDILSSQKFGHINFNHFVTHFTVMGNDYAPVNTGKLSYDKIADWKGSQEKKLSACIDAVGMEVDLCNGDFIYINVEIMPEKTVIPGYKSVHSCKKSASNEHHNEIDGALQEQVLFFCSNTFLPRSAKSVITEKEKQLTELDKLGLWNTLVSKAVFDACMPANIKVGVVCLNITFDSMFAYNCNSFASNIKETRGLHEGSNAVGDAQTGLVSMIMESFEIPKEDSDGPGRDALAWLLSLPVWEEIVCYTCNHIVHVTLLLLPRLSFLGDASLVTIKLSI